MLDWMKKLPRLWYWVIVIGGTLIGCWLLSLLIDATGQTIDWKTGPIRFVIGDSA